jgi:hypothetical protein
MMRVYYKIIGRMVIRFPSSDRNLPADVSRKIYLAVDTQLHNDDHVTDFTCLRYPPRQRL